MQKITVGSLKFAIGILVVTLLLLIFVSLAEYSFFTEYLYILMFALYIYNFWYFKLFSETELEYRKLKGITIALTIYFTVSILSSILALSGSGLPFIPDILMMIAYFFIMLIYAIKLFRIETEEYGRPLNFIAAAILLSAFYYFLDNLIIQAYPELVEKTKDLWFIYGLSEMACIYLYWQTLQHIQQYGYKKSEEKYMLNEFNSSHKSKK